MVRRFELDKINTIIKDRTENLGLHPIMMLNHGYTTSRGIVHISDDAVESIREMIGNSTLSDLSKLKITLNMYNCGSVDTQHFSRAIPSHDELGMKKRATSFDIIAVHIPKQWDRGVGFDNADDFWYAGDSAVSKESSSWYFSRNHVKWEQDGIYSNDELSRLYYDYVSNEAKNKIKALQHFDFGNEDLKLDITDYVLSLVNKETPNNGLMICYSPDTEQEEYEYTSYTGFFTDKTNTFFKPFIEVRYNDYVHDNRQSFQLGKTNRLYLDTEGTELDEMPKCSVDGKEFEVVKCGNGLYYSNVRLSSNEYSPEQILTDVWSNLSVCGEHCEDVEREFVTLPFSIFKKNALQSTIYSVMLNGINHAEKLIVGEKRRVLVNFRIPYTRDTLRVDDEVMYRVYVKMGEKEIDVIDWDFVNIVSLDNYFDIDTSSFCPNTYHIDIKFKEKVYKDELEFKIVNNATKLSR